jgi:hypothetical protein
MASFDKKSITIAAAVILIFLSLITNIMPYGQEPHHLRFSAEGGACIDYDQSENTIAIDCNASFLDVVQTINDPNVIDNLGGGEYILNANLEVADDVTFEMTSSNEDSGGLQYLKIAGENGIIVHGKILINGVKITSWDVSDEDVIQQNIDGAIRRAYVQFAASEGSQIINSDFGYLGYQDFGRRGFDIWRWTIS